MSRRSTIIRRLFSSTAMIAAGVASAVALFLGIWWLLLPHFEALGGVYRLAADAPPASANDPALVAAVLAAAAAAFVSGVLVHGIRAGREAL